MSDARALREAAEWVVDNWDRGASQGQSMPALRAAVGCLRDTRALTEYDNPQWLRKVIRDLLQYPQRPEAIQNATRAVGINPPMTEREVAEIVHGAHVAWIDRAGVTGAARGDISLNAPCDDCLSLGRLIAGLRPGGWRAVANDFQRTMFRERARADVLEVFVKLVSSLDRPQVAGLRRKITLTQLIEKATAALSAARKASP